VPLESLMAGDTVRIFWRDKPYREKLMISGKGTANSPIRVCGVPGPAGQLPVIDGQDATTRPQLEFPYDGHQVRGLVIIGHAHGAPWGDTPSYIVLEGLEVRNAAPPYTFTDRSGKTAAYSAIATGIFVERANHVTIRGCTVTANNNGIFVGTGTDETTMTRDVLIEHNYVHDNGSLADYYEHNVYNEASGVVYQYNRFGPPRGGKAGVLGTNIKERSAGVVIRYNWIEDGAHILDIVDAQEARDVTRPMPSFHATYVYGNVIIRGTTPSGTMIHYGGDSGTLGDYRKGTLFFYNNTVIVRNDSYPAYTRTGVFELTTNDEQLDSRDNVYFSTAVPDELRAVGLLGSRDNVSSGVATFAGDWVKRGWTAHGLTPGANIELRAVVHDLDKMKRGDVPGFRDVKGEDYALGAPGPVAAVSLRPTVPLELLPTAQYVKHQQGKPRAEPLTVGALDQ
jgi:parallel beta-helix repeat protein